MADYCTVEVKFFPKKSVYDEFTEANKLAFNNFANVFINFKKDNRFFSFKSLINNYFKEKFYAISDNRHLITYLSIDEDEITMDVDMAYGPEDIQVFHKIIERYIANSIGFIYTCYGNGYHITTDPEGPLYHIYVDDSDKCLFDQSIYKDDFILNLLEKENILKINDIAFRLFLFQLEKEKKSVLLENQINTYLRKAYSNFDFCHVKIYKYVDEEGRSIA